MTRRTGMVALLAAHLFFMAAVAAAPSAAAMQILDAADHAELAAQISATQVNRIALSRDRIARVVRSPDGFAVEHDGASGDLYLRPSARAESHAFEPVTLFVGTEKGFTYRLTLTPSVRDSAQILIRNGAAVADAAVRAPAPGDSARVAALVRLVRAVARREVLPGYEIVSSAGGPVGGLTLIETWRGPRFAAHVFEAARPALEDADGAWPGPRSGHAGLAGTIGEALDAGRAAGGGRLAALWLAASGTGPSGGRLGVAVTEAALPARGPGQAAGAPR